MWVLRKIQVIGSVAGIFIDWCTSLGQEYPLTLFIALLLSKSSSVVPFSAQSTGFQIGRLNHSFWMPCFTEGKTIASPIGLWPKQLWFVWQGCTSCVRNDSNMFRSLPVFDMYVQSYILHFVNWNADKMYRKFHLVSEFKTDVPCPSVSRHYGSPSFSTVFHPHSETTQLLSTYLFVSENHI